MPRYHRVVIVGVGLLGGSIGLALRRRNLAEQVIGVGRSIETLKQAKDLGVITEFSSDLESACTKADLIVIGTPVQTIADYIKKCCRSPVNPDCFLTDVGSTKVSICQALSDFEHHRFCGSHPMAGSEKTGVSNAREDLFVGKKTIITPVANSSAMAIEQTTTLWNLLGSEIVRLTPLEHDQAVAKISHLPHVVAAALAANTDQSLLSLIGDGWRDTTRVAGGEVELWRQIICENQQPILAALRRYSESLTDWIKAIDANDQQNIARLLEQGKSTRDAIVGVDGSRK